MLVCAFFGLGFFTMYGAHSLPMVYIANIFMGIVQPYFVARISEIVPKERATMSIAYLGVVYSTAYFLASYIIPFVEGMANSTTVRNAYLLWGVIWSACAIVALINALFVKKPFQQTVEA